MSITLLIDTGRLDELMAERAWDVSELSRQTGLHRVTLYPIVNGSTVPRRSSIRRIAEALGVATSEITRESGDAS